MAVTPLKVFLFLFGATAAAGAVAYGTGSLDPLLGRGPGNASSVAALPEPAPSEPAAPKGERVTQPPEETPGGTMMAAVPPADDPAAPPARAAEPPAADAPPAGPQLPAFDIVRIEADGSLVVAGKAMADAVVELLHGEATLGSARATTEGDFAIVLDEKLKPGDYQLALRATPPGGAAVMSVQTAVLSVPDKSGGQVLAMVEQPGEASTILTVPQPDAPADGGTSTDKASSPAEAPKTEEAAGPPAGEEKPADVASTPAETPPADQPKTDEAAVPGAEDKPADIAAAPEEAAKPAESAPAAVEARVAVEAIEIDGGKIFVAGIGQPGRFVRVYASEIVLGEAKVSEGGRFLVEAERDLPVGEYVIRADLLDADGIKVIARAAVPFEREPGEAIAAVAPPAGEPAEKPADVATAEPEQPVPPAGSGKPADTAAAEPPTAPQPEQPVEAAETSPPADDAAGTSPPDAAAAEAPPAAEPAGTAPAVAAAEPGEPPATTEQPAAAAEATPPAAGADVAAAPPETVSPKLQKVAGAVIIRRSDTLWRISRRVYGRGIRYWTIYLANQNQIADPNRIWPGQVFRVPEKSQEGEPADMSAMGSQMTTMPKAE